MKHKKAGKSCIGGAKYAAKEYLPPPLKMSGVTFHFSCFSISRKSDLAVLDFKEKEEGKEREREKNGRMPYGNLKWSFFLFETWQYKMLKLNCCRKKGESVILVTTSL